MCVLTNEPDSVLWRNCVRIREVRDYYILPGLGSLITRSETASFSRSLRRPERRGLVELFNSKSGGDFKKDMIKLTREGAKIAEPFSKGFSIYETTKKRKWLTKF